MLYACSVPIYCMKAEGLNNTMFCTRKLQHLASVSVSQSSFMVFLLFLDLPLMLRVTHWICFSMKKKKKDIFLKKHIHAFSESSGKLQLLHQVICPIHLPWGSQDSDSSFKMLLAPKFVFRIQKPFTRFCKIHVTNFQVMQTLYFESWHAEPSLLLWKRELLNKFISDEKMLSDFKYRCSYSRFTGFQSGSPAG